VSRVVVVAAKKRLQMLVAVSPGPKAVVESGKGGEEGNEGERTEKAMKAMKAMR
jgi:hypothetical protein